MLDLAIDKHFKHLSASVSGLFHQKPAAFPSRKRSTKQFFLKSSCFLKVLLNEVLHGLASATAMLSSPYLLGEENEYQIHPSIDAMLNSAKMNHQARVVSVGWAYLCQQRPSSHSSG